MKSFLLWIGVLAVSVALGAGLYGLVARPADASGLAVSGPSAQPSPTPTVYRYKTKVVKDPPERVVVDVPGPAAAAPTDPGSPAAIPARSVASTGDDSRGWQRSDHAGDDRGENRGDDRSVED